MHVNVSTIPYLCDIVRLNLLDDYPDVDSRFIKHFTIYGIKKAFTEVFGFDVVSLNETKEMSFLYEDKYCTMFEKSIFDNCLRGVYSAVNSFHTEFNFILRYEQLFFITY